MTTEHHNNSHNSDKKDTNLSQFVMVVNNKQWGIVYKGQGKPIPALK